MFNYSELFSMAECLFCTRGPFCTGSLLHETLLQKRHFSMRGSFSRCHFCKSGQFCIANILHERLFWTEGHFCTASILHGKIFARLQLLHDVAFALRDFCKASLLHGVIILRKYLFTTKFLTTGQFWTKL